MKDKIKIWIADDHELVRHGLKALIEKLDEVEIIGQSMNGKAIIQQLRNQTQIDIALLDIEMPDKNGLETLVEIKKNFFGVKVILLTMLNDKKTIQQAYDLGADGFLFKNSTLEELRMAFQKVMTRERYFSPEVITTLMSNKTFLSEDNIVLSERETEILKMIAEGLSSTEIGARLFISPRTVDTHRNNLIQKLKVNGIIGLVKYAIQHKLI